MDQLQFLTSDLLLNTKHGCFNRHGGYSFDPYKSLNVGLHVGDQIDHVRKNFQKIKHAIGTEHIAFCKQTHSKNIKIIKETTGIEGINDTDAIITDVPNIALMIQQADCQAVLIYDNEKKVISNIHNGWRGSVQNIIQATIQEMKINFASNPKNLKAVVSPSLGPCCSEFKNYKTELPTSFLTYMWKEYYFDFWKISKSQLIEEGVLELNIEVLEVCTVCNRDYFSYRRCQKEKVASGRQSSIIML